MKSFLLALPLVLCATGASAAELYVCPKSGVASRPLALPSSPDDSAPWHIHLPKGEITMFLTGTTLYCKYEGVLMTKEVGEGCVLGADGGNCHKPSF